MSYSIRRWMSSENALFDDSAEARTADEAIRQAERLLGIYKSLVDNGAKQAIRDLQPGEKMFIRRPALKISLRIKRRKR